MSIATLLEEIARRPDTMLYLLRIAGIDAVWASAPVDLDGETVIAEIADVSVVTAEVDALTRRVTAGRFSVYIDAGPGTASYDLLLPRGRTGAGRTVQLADDIEQEDETPTVEVMQSIADWPASGTLHIGTEAMRYTSRTVEAPHEFEVAERGYLDTDVQYHVVEGGGLVRPLIYDQAVTWGWRPCTLSIGRRRLDGSPHPDEVELAAGWTIGAPDHDARGRITVTLTSLPAGLQVQVGGQPSTTGVMNGAIALGADDPHRTVLARLRWRRGQVLRARCADVVDGDIEGIVYAGHQDVFDITEGDARAGPVSINGSESIGVEAYRNDPSDGTGVIDTASALNIGGRPLIENAEVAVDLEVEVAAAGADAIIEMPSAVITAVADGWNPGTTQGADGMWADLRLEPRLPGLGGAPGLTARLNSDLHEGALDIILPSGRTEGLPVPLRETLWYLADLSDPDATPNGPQPQPLDGIDARDVRWPAERVFPVSLGKSDTSTARAAIPIRGLASGGWQTGMGYLYVKDDVFGAAPFEVRVRFEAQDGSAQATTLSVIDKFPASDWTEGAPGHLLKLDEVSRWRGHSFGIFDGRQEPQISQVVRWSKVDPRRALLELLTSTWGRGVNGEYDTLPSGAFMRADRVDAQSFLDFPVPGGVVDLIDDLDLSRPITVEDAVDGLMSLMQAEMVLALDESTGRLVFRLQGAGPPIASEARRTFTADQLASKPRFARGGVDNRVHTSQIFEANVDRDDEPMLVVQIDDAAALRENGGRISSHVVRLLGVRLAASAAQADAQLRPIAEARQVLVGAPRHHIVASCTLADSLLIHPGAVVVISAPTAADERGQTGTLIDVPARVVAVKRDLKRAMATMTLTYMRTDIAGIAPALRIDGSPSADSVTVLLNRYSLPAHPVTGLPQTDLDFWQVDDRARVVPRGRYEDSLGELYVRQIDMEAKRVYFDVDDGLGGREPADLPAVLRASPYGTVRFEHWDLANGDDADGNPRTWGQTLESQGRRYAFFGPIAARATASNPTGSFQYG